MREIKFRAWDKKEKRMMRVAKINFTWDGKFLEVHCIDNDYKKEYWLPFPKIELMQFTGLKDKNGKEIFEGDILRYKPHKIISDETVIDVVEYDEFGFQPFLEEARVDADYTEIEIIGNIYENPTIKMIRTKDNKYLKIEYMIDTKSIFISNYNHITEEWDILEMPFSRIPQLIRGLFSTFQRFQRRVVKQDE
jgi:uncharacterized phage protein (TIGR01671 family)